jgi:hypothetical protein
MQQIVINIENKELEEKLLETARRKGRKLTTIILETLESNFLKKKSPQFRYKKLDPLKHMSKIDYEVDESAEEDLNDVILFKDIKDSAAYVRELRKNTWRR